MITLTDKGIHIPYAQEGRKIDKYDKERWETIKNDQLQIIKMKNTISEMK